MTATVTINRRAVEFTVTEVATGDALRADLVARGFDGTVWTGVAPATARRGEKHGLFYRTPAGQFVAGVIL